MGKQKVTKHRVQVNLPSGLYLEVRKMAYEQNVSISEVVRKSLEKRVPRKTKDKSWETFINKYVGFIKGHPDDSTTHDKWAHKTAVFHKK